MEKNSKIFVCSHVYHTLHLTIVTLHVVEISLLLFGFSH